MEDCGRTRREQSTISNQQSSISNQFPFLDPDPTGWLIVELKTAKVLADEHSAQVLGYLKPARLEHGLLITFGSYQFELRKFAWSQEAAPAEE